MGLKHAVFSVIGYISQGLSPQVLVIIAPTHRFKLTDIQHMQYPYPNGNKVNWAIDTIKFLLVVLIIICYFKSNLSCKLFYYPYHDCIHLGSWWGLLALKQGSNIWGNIPVALALCHDCNRSHSLLMKFSTRSHTNEWIH